MVDSILSPFEKTPCKTQSFLQDDAGAVGVDWVFLTAACVTLAIVTMVSVGSGTLTAVQFIETGLNDSAGIFCETSNAGLSCN